MGRTPRELLASVTSEDITEMMAYALLEPFGPLQEAYRAGQIAAVVANVHRDRQHKSDPFTPADFMPELRDGACPEPAAHEPILLPDPKAQAALIKAAVFKIAQ